MNNKTVSIHTNKLIVDGKAFFMRGAEIHYFRMSVNRWRKSIKQAKTGGINTISSYMPWYWHEPQEGLIDFNGKICPERNLKLFLDICADLEMKVIARPGPFINSELRLGGFPEWLFRDYPETMSHRMDGNIATGRPCPAEGEPLYRQLVRAWYEQIVPLIAKYDANNGGPVIMFQPDNELSAGWSYGFGNSLYDPTVISQFWPCWLQKKYVSINELNKYYHSNYNNFSDVKVPRKLPENATEKTWCWDWMSFKRWFFADYGATLAKWAIDLGIKVPMVFNEPVASFYGHGDHAGFGDVMIENSISGISSCHTYADRIMDLEGIQNTILGIKTVRSSPWNGPAYSLEANAGWYVPRLGRSEINWETLLRLGIAHGLQGTVIYPYAAAEVSYKDTIEGTEYWSPACIDIDGSISPAYYHLKKYNSFIDSWEELLTDSEPVYDILLAYSPAYRLVDFFGAHDLLKHEKSTDKVIFSTGGEIFDSEPVLDRDGTVGHDWIDGYESVSKQTAKSEAGMWKKVKDSMLLLSRLNYGYELLELTNPNKAPGKGCIIVATTGTLETKAIDYLLEHLNKGGKCIFAPTVPVYTEKGKRDERLLDYLGMHLRELVRPAGASLMDYGCRVIEYGDEYKVGVNNWIFIHDFPEEAIHFAHYNKQTIAAFLKQKNVAVVGIEPTFTTLANKSFWQYLITELTEFTPTVECKGNYLHATLRKGQNSSVLTVMNLGSTGVSNVIINQPYRGLEKLELTLELGLHEARCLILGGEHNETKIVYSTSEIHKDKRTGDLLLYGLFGTSGEIAFEYPVNVMLNGKKKTTTAKGCYYVICYEHQKNRLNLKILKSYD